MGLFDKLHQVVMKCDFHVPSWSRYLLCRGSEPEKFSKSKLFYIPTGNPSSKYEHRRTSALLRNIRNIRICMGKKPIVSVTYENERISIKNSLPYLKCVLRLSCEVHGPIYCRFMGFYVNGFLSKGWALQRSGPLIHQRKAAVNSLQLLQSP